MSFSDKPNFSSNGNVIMACHITGVYDVNRNETLHDDSYELVRAWAESIANKKLHGIIFHNNFSAETCRKYENDHISFIRVDYNPAFNPNVFRYFVYRDFLEKNGISTSQEFVLITSAFHMTRAKGCFDKVGLKTVTFPVDYYSHEVKFDIPALIFPNADSISQWHKLIKEWIGITIYSLVGYL